MTRLKKINPKNKNIILSFDLDYTLIDNTEGILNSFKYALKKHDIPKLDDDSIKKMIGIPLNEMFSQVSDLDPSMLSESFRKYYAKEGIYQVELYLGVLEKLKELKKDYKLGIITSKKQEMAIKLLKYLKIDSFFEYIIGENEVIKSKLDLAIKNFIFSNFPNHKVVIIGDHPKDKKLSEMLNCPFIGVLTGNHSERQLKRNNDQLSVILENVMSIDKNLILSLFKNN